DDAQCVMHSHTTAGMAVAAQEQGLLPLNQMSMKFFGRISYHDYEGIALDLDERERLVRDLGNNNAMGLRPHGLLSPGRPVADAFYEMYSLEQACRLQVAATQGGQKAAVPPDSMVERTARQFESFESNGQRPWAALKRRLDRESPQYAS